METNIVDGKSAMYFPVNGALNSSGPWEFNVMSSDVDYCYLPSARLFGTYQIVKVFICILF